MMRRIEPTGRRRSRGERPLIPSLCRALPVVLLAAGISRLAAGQSAAPPVYDPANGHWYQVARGAMLLTWHDARRTAEQMSFAGYSGHLVTLTSIEETQFVISRLPLATAEHWWIGAYQELAAPDYREPDAGWRWVTGEPWSFTAWYPNQPDNHQGAEHAAEIDTRFGDRWNDLSTLTPLGAFIVEYEAPPLVHPLRLQLSPNPVIGGASVTGRATLAVPAGPTGVVLSLFSSNTAAALVPAVLLVPAGVTSVTFPVATLRVAAPTSVTILASGLGLAGTALLQVLPDTAPPPSDNLLVNGSFEEPRVPPGAAWRTIEAGGALPGWRVTGGNVDLISADYWLPPPGEGSQSLDLLGHLPGTIEQTLVTVPGEAYLLSGWMAHNVYDPSGSGSAQVWLNGQPFISLVHRDPAAAPRDMRWQPFAYRFRATANATTLALVSLDGPFRPGGLALDGLAVTLVVDTTGPVVTPGTPTRLSVRLIAPTQIELSWIDNAPDEIGFEIHRRPAAGDWSWVATVGPDTTRYADHSATPATPYAYRVRALTPRGVTSWAPEVTVTTLPP